MLAREDERAAIVGRMARLEIAAVLAALPPGRLASALIICKNDDSRRNVAQRSTAA